MLDPSELRALAATARNIAAKHSACAKAALMVGHGIDLDVARHLDHEGRDLALIAELLEEEAARRPRLRVVV